MDLFARKACILQLSSMIYLVFSATRADAGGSNSSGALVLPPFGHARYLGCWRDTASADEDGRAIVMDDNNMSPQRCISVCWDTRYIYALLKLGRQCQCIMSLRNMKPSYTPECKLPCQGGRAYPCGSLDHVSVFHTGYFPEPDYASLWEFIPNSFVGCYSDKFGELCRGLEIVSKRMSVGFCLSVCEQQLAAYAGLQDAADCCCASIIGPLTTWVDEDWCSVRCGTGEGFICGGETAVLTAIYSTGVTTKRKPTQPFKEPVWMNSHIPQNLLWYVKAFPKTKLAEAELDPPAKSLLEELTERQGTVSRHIKIALWVLAGSLALSVILLIVYCVWRARRLRSRMDD